jgi:hypothetical protein
MTIQSYLKIMAMPDHLTSLSGLVDLALEYSLQRFKKSLKPRITENMATESLPKVEMD